MSEQAYQDLGIREEKHNANTAIRHIEYQVEYKGHSVDGRRFNNDYDDAIIPANLTTTPCSTEALC